eukprot:CAMPEP_0116943812 /NCGR_PEP_ID=MMETSP0467-20121206/35416_1 /TAXON_ID=283647 /ORGANISM="Mesodinium pulex, Strain SPMC105" /LENGTH=46 /DNA_ID= /DNA_START= /DNA_END= /DNA_ORIENTATION=
MDDETMMETIKDMLFSDKNRHKGTRRKMICKDKIRHYNMITEEIDY